MAVSGLGSGFGFGGSSRGFGAPASGGLAAGFGRGGGVGGLDAGFGRGGRRGGGIGGTIFGGRQPRGFTPGFADPGSGSARAFRAFDRGVSLSPEFSVEGLTESVGRARGSALSAFASGDFAQALEFGARSLFGFEEETAFDPVMGFGTHVTGRPARAMLSLLPAGMGIAQAPALLAALGPASAAQAVLSGVSQGRTLAKAGGMLPGMDLGFRPATSLQQRAQARAKAGQPLSAAEQLAAQFTARETQRQTSMRERAASDSLEQRQTFAPRPVPVAPAPAPPVRSFRPDSASRLLAGQDPSADLDLLRTVQQAAVAQGRARARPNVGVAGRPPRAQALV